MVVAVIDGMGGWLGAQIVERLRKEGFEAATIFALGTNAVATQRMIEAGANRGASGENAIRVSVGQADFIFGPIGIVLPNAMMGEIAPLIAEAVCEAPGTKLLLPLNQPHVVIVGVDQKKVGNLIDQSISALKQILGK